jgi:hypothetical protein
MSRSTDAASLRSRLARAWCRLEGVSAGPVEGWMEAWRAIDAARAEPGLRPRPQPVDPDGMLQLWSALPAGARDLLVLRAVAGFELARIAALQARPLALIEREWLLLARRLAGRHEDWPRRLRASIEACAPAPAAPPPRRLGLRLGLLSAGLACLIAAAFAPELYEALLPDPAGQRLQPARERPRLQEQVPLSAAEFALFADPVEFSLLARLDLLLWRLGQQGRTPAATLSAGEGVPVVDPSLQIPPGLDALEPWVESWPRLTAAQRAQLLAHAQLWQTLDAPARARLLARAEAFNALPPLERAQLRLGFERFRRLGGSDRQALAAAEEAFQALPDSQQEALRSEFAALPGGPQSVWAGAADSELLSLAGEAFGFVPAGEREPTLQLLAALDAEAHALLKAMARRLDASQREALRAELLAAPASERAALLRARAGTVGLSPRR